MGGAVRLRVACNAAPDRPAAVVCLWLPGRNRPKPVDRRLQPVGREPAPLRGESLLPPRAGLSNRPYVYMLNCTITKKLDFKPTILKELQQLFATRTIVF